MNKGKYNYWHLVIEAGADCPEIKEGMVTTNNVIQNGWITLIDNKGNILRDTYKLQYLGRARRDLNDTDLTTKLNQLKYTQGLLNNV